MTIHHFLSTLANTRYHSLFLCLGFVCLIGILPAGGQDYSYPPSISLDKLQEHVEKAPKQHPRLLITPDGLAKLKQSVKKNPLRKSLAKVVINHADYLLNVSPIERKKQGRRLLGQSRRCVERTIVLSMAYHLTGEDKYVKRCEKEMLDVAKFSDWNPSHFLDVAEMTFAMAIGYDWLYDQLSEESRKTIREAIIQKGVILPFETRHNGWVKSRNNWGQVCHGGLTAGALAVMEDEPELAARTVHNALQNVTYSMAAYAPNGSYPEGPGYWSYGTTYNVLLIAILESFIDANFGLTNAPGFDKTGQYLSLVTGPSGYTFNYADGGAGRRPEPARFWFASRYDRPDWLLNERDILAERLRNLIESDGRSSGGRFLPLTLLWMEDAPDDLNIQMPLHWSSEGHVPVTLHRSSWTDPNAVFVGLKAGSPSANHGQMDIGSFVLDADGVRWAMDLGAEGYHGIESRGMNLWDRSQDSDRWTIFRQQNYGHNTLVIDDQLQIAKNEGHIIQFSDDPEFPHSIVDMSEVYEGQAKSVKRGVALLPSNEVLIQDELTGLKPSSTVRWGMITPANPGKAENPIIKLQQNGKSLVLTKKSTAHPAKWEIINTSKPRNEWDSLNRGTCMVALNETAPEDGNLTITVLLTPGSCKESVREELEVKPLKSWGK